MSDDTVPEDERMQPSSDEDELTKGSGTRWEWLATVVVGATTLVFLLLIFLAALGIVTLSVLTQPWFLLFSTVVVASYAYALGKEYVSYKSGK